MKEKKETTAFRIAPSDLERVRQAAQADDRSLAAFIRWAVLMATAQWERQAGPMLESGNKNTGTPGKGGPVLGSATGRR